MANVKHNVVLMYRLPPVITSTLRVICTQYCPHLLTTGISIPPNTNNQNRLKYHNIERVWWFSPTLSYLAQIILDGWGLDYPLQDDFSASRTLLLLDKLGVWLIII